MTQTRKLRELLAAPRMVRAPGVYDGITARLSEQAGFPALYMTGAGTSAARGYPDFGLITMSEMAGNGEVIARSVDIPVIADADTGYGNELNVTRTVREYERAGIAGLHLEDQAFPKKCGHLDDKEVIPRDEYIAKVRAAVAARRDPDFLIIARTDAGAVLGWDEAIERANLALEAGADMAFVEAARTLEQVAAIPRLVNGPCLLNMVRAGKTPDLALGEAEAMGYRLTIMPGLLLSTIMMACDEVLKQVMATDAPPSSKGVPSVRERFQRWGADEWDALRTRFRDPVVAKAAE
ncbi:isocitrate lyase/PEP mutase family protein [Roseococcus sp. SYP-B2431]|uniref:isocitrate lyase/PEP mutase family protein n=1 Tax=Roseococcus sp. SYP-B2431 TaxID=2496640 RepID=UPI00103B6F03|nr:isocitrate lyase/PEP mutase family protein [Roseococcus sp. SYP-B2431]TCI00329.1 isocitrate lyase/PEP mutase family protein [Roseococcus sp. SYP-B2431]